MTYLEVLIVLSSLTALVVVCQTGLVRQGTRGIGRLLIAGEVGYGRGARRSRLRVRRRRERGNLAFLVVFVVFLTGVQVWVSVSLATTAGTPWWFRCFLVVTVLAALAPLVVHVPLQRRALRRARHWLAAFDGSTVTAGCSRRHRQRRLLVELAPEAHLATPVIAATTPVAVTAALGVVFWLRRADAPVAVAAYVGCVVALVVVWSAWELVRRGNRWARPDLQIVRLAVTARPRAWGGTSVRRTRPLHAARNAFIVHARRQLPNVPRLVADDHRLALSRYVDAVHLWDDQRSYRGVTREEKRLIDGAVDFLLAESTEQRTDVLRRATGPGVSTTSGDWLHGRAVAARAAHSLERCATAVLGVWTVASVGMFLWNVGLGGGGFESAFTTFRP